jgi:CDP-diacylglycerol--serine O-phosphatidyltransferase
LIEGTPKIDKKNFVGLPIPPAAGLLASIVYLHPLPLNIFDENLSHIYTISMIILMVVLGLLMVSTIRYTSFKSIGKGKQSIYILLLIAALGMLTWLYSRYMLFGIAFAYVAHGILWYLFGFLRPHKRNVEANEAN